MRIIGCCIDSIACTVNYFRIPRLEGIGISVIRILRRSCWNSYLIAIVIGVCTQHRTILVLKDYCVIYEVRIIGCNVSCITCAVYYFRIPRLEGVSIGVVCILSRSCGDSYLITVVVSLGAEHCSVLIFEDYSVVKVRKFIYSRIRDISETYFIYDSIPTNKLITCQHIGLYRGIVRYNYGIILLILCLTDYRAVIIFEYYGIGGFYFRLSVCFYSQRCACLTCVIGIIFGLSTEEYVVSITIKTGKYIALLPIYTVTAIFIAILCNKDNFIIHFFEHSWS